jgi:O-glycosyl hydrolase
MHARRRLTQRVRRSRSVAVVVLVTAVLLTYGAVSRSVQSPAHAATVRIDPNNVYVSNWEGFGTTLGWWANVTGGWAESQRTALADAVFSRNGLGFTVARYNIGASPANQSGMRTGALIRSYLNPDGSYDWNVDANQRWMLAAAQARGVNVTEAFANSPPWFMTVTGDPRGNNGCEDNLTSSNYDRYADYLTEVVRHFRDSWGTTFRTLDPFNEPTHCWGMQQEGAHFSREGQNALLPRVAAALRAKGQYGTSLSWADDANVGEANTTLTQAPQSTLDATVQINTHTYGGDNAERNTLRHNANLKGKRLVMSEVDGPHGTGALGGHNHNAIEPALWLSQRITDDMNNLRPNNWVFWQAVEDERNMQPDRENSNWGLIHADMAGTSHTYSLTKKYHGMGNFSRFLRPGMRILNPQNTPNSVIGWDPAANRLVIVHTNWSSSDVSNTWDLSAFGSTGGSAAQYRTSSSENLADVGSVGVSDGTFTATAAANSVTTYVVDGVTAPGTLYEALIARHSGQSLDVFDGSTADGTPVVQWTDNSNGNQQWRFVDLGNGHHHIVNRNSGRCLDVDGGSTADGAAVIQWACGGGENQQWRLVANGPYLNVIARHSGKCLDVPSGSLAAGTALVQYTCGAGSHNQQWTRR